MTMECSDRGNMVGNLGGRLPGLFVDFLATSNIRKENALYQNQTCPVGHPRSRTEICLFLCLLPRR